MRLLVVFVVVLFSSFSSVNTSHHLLILKEDGVGDFKVSQSTLEEVRSKLEKADLKIKVVEGVEEYNNCSYTEIQIKKEGFIFRFGGKREFQGDKASILTEITVKSPCDQKFMNKIELGVSTEEDVHSLLGKPDDDSSNTSYYVKKKLVFNFFKKNKLTSIVYV